MTKLITVSESEWDKLEAVYEAALESVPREGTHWARLIEALDAVQTKHNNLTDVEQDNLNPTTFNSDDSIKGSGDSKVKTRPIAELPGYKEALDRVRSKPCVSGESDGLSVENNAADSRHAFIQSQYRLNRCALCHRPPRHKNHFAEQERTEIARLSSERRSIFEAGFDAGALDAEGGVIIDEDFKKETLDKAYAAFISDQDAES